MRLVCLLTTSERSSDIVICRITFALGKMMVKPPVWSCITGMRAELGLKDDSDEESDSFSSPPIMLSAHGDSSPVKAKPEVPKPVMPIVAKSQVCPPATYQFKNCLIGQCLLNCLFVIECACCCCIHTMSIHTYI